MSSGCGAGNNYYLVHHTTFFSQLENHTMFISKDDEQATRLDCARVSCNTGPDSAITLHGLLCSNKYNVDFRLMDKVIERQTKQTKHRKVPISYAFHDIVV